MARSNPNDDGTSVGFIDSWIGHGIIDSLMIPVIAILLGLYVWISHTQVLASDLVLGVILFIAANSFLVSLLERPEVLRTGHPAPGGWKYALPSFVVPPVLGLAIGLLFERDWFLPFTLGTAVPLIALAVGLHPWRKHMDRKEFRGNMRKTQEFIDNKRLEKGWTPEVKAVKDRHNKAS